MDFFLMERHVKLDEPTGLKTSPKQALQVLCAGPLASPIFSILGLKSLCATYSYVAQVWIDTTWPLFYLLAMHCLVHKILIYMKFSYSMICHEKYRTIA